MLALLCFPLARAQASRVALRAPASIGPPQADRLDVEAYHHRCKPEHVRHYQSALCCPRQRRCPVPFQAGKTFMLRLWLRARAASAWLARLHMSGMVFQEDSPASPCRCVGILLTACWLDTVLSTVRGAEGGEQPCRPAPSRGAARLPSLSPQS